MWAAVFDQEYPAILLQQQNILAINPERRAKAVMELIQPNQSVKCHQIAPDKYAASRQKNAHRSGRFRRLYWPWCSAR